MIPVFRVEHFLALTIPFLLAAGTASAQQPASGSPTPLSPDSAPQALEAPPPGLPGAVMEASPAATKEDGVSGIEVGELGTLDPDSVGVLDPSIGGFRIDMWAGTDRRLLLRLLPRLPSRYNSPTMHDLARRLLLSTAIAPPRSDNDQGSSLVALRIERLAAMGLSGAVAEMMTMAPAPESEPLLMRIHIDNRLLLGDYEGACQAATGADQAVLDSPYREQIAVFCNIQAGNPETATFTANLLRESGELDDPAFFTLADALTAGTPADVKSLTEPKPIHLAMAEAAEATLPDDVLETDSPLMLRAFADTPLVSQAVRLAAAERAAMAGAFSSASLAELYAAVEFSRQELDNALSIASKDHNPRNRALLYQAAQLQSLPVARAAAIQKAWELGRADGFFRLAAAVYRPQLEALSPSPELLWFTPEAVRALLLLTRPDQALTWAEAMQRSAREPEDKQAAALLWPLVALAEGSATGPGHGRWLAALSKTETDTANRRVAVAYSLLEAMGERISEDRWRALFEGDPRVSVTAASPSFMRTFRIAASGGHQGETVLLALLILGGSDLAELAPEQLSEIVVGLRKVGLESEARQLAIEAALAAGL